MTRADLIAAARGAPLLVSGGLAEPLAGHGAACLEVLNLEQPRDVRAAHADYLAAGARVIRTNTAGASPERLDRYRMHDEAFIVSYMAAEHAVQSARISTEETGVTRWVLGVARIESRVRQLGFLPLERVEAAARTMASGLAGGGVDAIVVETNQDGARLTAAFDGVRRGMSDAGRSVPVLLTLRYDALFATPHRDRVTEELARAAAAAAGLGVAALGVANTDLADGWTATLRAVARAFPGPLMVEAAPTSRDLAAILNDPILWCRLALVGGGASPQDTKLLNERLGVLKGGDEVGDLRTTAANDPAAAPARRPKGKL
ncbi:homocysteine S-methyltransferase family protein [Thalassobaculum sp.]|uniref:homocysteine S-methyltransferase family protein n=1 Tax=Thalassobaculum sp. TaxID=2022740 RepID=UPI0032ECF217